MPSGRPLGETRVELKPLNVHHPKRHHARTRAHTPIRTHMYTCTFVHMYTSTQTCYLFVLALKVGELRARAVCDSHIKVLQTAPLWESFLSRDSTVSGYGWRLAFARPSWWARGRERLAAKLPSERRLFSLRCVCSNLLQECYWWRASDWVSALLITHGLMFNCYCLHLAHPPPLGLFS